MRYRKVNKRFWLDKLPTVMKFYLDGEVWLENVERAVIVSPEDPMHPDNPMHDKALYLED